MIAGTTDLGFLLPGESGILAWRIFIEGAGKSVAAGCKTNYSSLGGKLAL